MSAFFTLKQTTSNEMIMQTAGARQARTLLPPEIVGIAERGAGMLTNGGRITIISFNW
jgi:hypothetical protein